MVREDGLGGAWLAWEDRRSGAPAVYALRLSGGGTSSPGWPPDGQRISPTLAVPTAAISPSLAVSGSNTVFVVWPDGRAPGGSRVYAQRLLSDGPVPVLIALAIARAGPRLVSLVGNVGGGSPTTVFVDRREDGGGWMELASVEADGTGRVTFDDRTVIPGQRLSYRLRAAGADGEVWSSEVSVAVPATPSFALRSIRPIPSGSRAVVAFSLPDARPAFLEVLDIGGRRVFECQVGSLGPGEHLFELTNPLPSPGVFLVKLTRGTESVVARGCSLR